MSEKVDIYLRVGKLTQFFCLQLVCEYYSYPPPAGGVSWRLNHNGGEGSTNDALAKINGLAWERGRNYWALVQSDAFNQYAPQTGVYTCEALDESGRVLSSDAVNVDGRFYL